MTAKKQVVKKKKAPVSAPYCFRCPWEKPDVSAMQALERGEASPEQQKRALDWIINNASGTYELAWEVDNERASSFEAGRRFVGIEVVKLLKINLNAFRSNTNE